jgi:ABC-type multidrug transport system permease subunit
MKRQVFAENLRIVTAFAIKDIRDAIQNKMILRIGIGTLVVWLSSMALPLMLAMRTTLDVRVYDPGRSSLIRELAKDDAFDVRRVRSEAELLEGVGGSSSEVMGLIVGRTIDEMVAAGDPITIDGYYPHWMEGEDVVSMQEIVEARLRQAGGGPIRVDVSQGARYPSFQSVGQSTMTSSALVIVIFTVGGMLTPYLMVEEKEKGTLAALMVSPAKQSQFVLGKALAGLFYSLIVALVALFMSQRWIVHWDLAIIAVIAGSIFTVALGLLVGIFTENPSGMGLWLGLLMLFILVPVFMEFSPPTGDLSWWQTLLKWLPSVGFSDLIRASFVEAIPANLLLRGLLSLLGTAAGLLVLVTWRLRRVEM